MRRSPAGRRGGSDAAPAAAKAARNGINWTAASIVLSALLAVGGLYYTGRQVVDQQKQFVQTSRQSRYNEILSGLSDKSPAVQISAITRLVDFVADGRNFPDASAQKTVGRELQLTLVEYIRATADYTGLGLKAYKGSRENWVLGVTATRQMQELLNKPGLEDVRLHGLDLSHVDLHGYASQDLQISANLFLDGVDLREASLTGIKVSPDNDVNLEQADLTCADLNGTPHAEASLGRADLAHADLTGANLNYLDLSLVTGLTSDQIRHATWNSGTKWPPALRGLPPSSTDAMQDIHGLCTYVINRMTGMLPGEGYQNTTPYPVGPTYTAQQRHALTVERIRRGCLAPPPDRQVPPKVLLDATDKSIRTLLRPCR
jgi:uncharacterized protein YjbI with pentapeptide repeats